MLIFVAFLKYCSMFSFNVVNHSYIRLLKYSFPRFILPSFFICSLVTEVTKYIYIFTFIFKRLFWNCPMNFINEKLERRFSYKSIFLAEMANET